MAKEANLWDSVKKRLDRAPVFYQRVEDKSVSGVPDVWIGGKGWGAWVELKAVEGYPLQAKTKVFGNRGLRPYQVNWLLKATARGVAAFIYCGVGVGIRRECFLIPAGLAARFNNMTREELGVYYCPLEDLAHRLCVRS